LKTRQHAWNAAKPILSSIRGEQARNIEPGDFELRTQEEVGMSKLSMTGKVAIVTRSAQGLAVVDGCTAN
jgi:hypothetical protein